MSCENAARTHSHAPISHAKIGPVQHELRQFRRIHGHAVTQSHAHDKALAQHTHSSPTS